ncbi:hypothetical protein PoB_001771300 [Plakobranchus ocellatus]|uniref:SPX domain-containing protein n=1 Tax=Plakobranchus ocellatus TaxID=259542 RepID=A0AAV3Z9S9_9GAST|nr:hypothetical protein PoB_001771300 [Plakobranchus ocellatus]
MSNAPSPADSELIAESPSDFQTNSGLTSGLSQDIDVINLEDSEYDSFLDYTNDVKPLLEMNEPDFEKLGGLQQHIEYHSKLLKFYTDLNNIFKEQGYKAAEDFELRSNLPKKPEPVTFQQKTKRKQTKNLNSFRVLELLQELKKYLINEQFPPSFLTFEETEDIEKLKKKLLECEKQYKQKSVDILNLVAVYGQYLKNLRTTYFGRFNAICREVLNITPRWARELCKISCVLSKYKKLQQLNLPVKMISSLVKHIEEACNEHTDEGEFWK